MTSAERPPAAWIRPRPCHRFSRFRFDLFLFTYTRAFVASPGCSGTDADVVAAHSRNPLWPDQRIWFGRRRETITPVLLFFFLFFTDQLEALFFWNEKTRLRDFVIQVSNKPGSHMALFMPGSDLLPVCSEPKCCKSWWWFVSRCVPKCFPMQSRDISASLVWACGGDLWSAQYCVLMYCTRTVYTAC